MQWLILWDSWLTVAFEWKRVSLKEKGIKLSEINENEIVAHATMNLLGNGDFRRGQVGLIIAETGVGKSVYSFDLAARLVLGGFLYNKESIPIRPNLKVQVFTSEYDEFDVMRTMKGLEFAFPNVEDWQERLDGEYLDIPVDGDRLGFVLAKIAERRKEFGADIFILDNFFSMFGIKNTSPVNAERVMAELIRFADELGIGVIIVHHCGKTGSKGANAGYGSSVLGAKARFEIVLSKTDFTANDQYLLVNFKKRFTNVSNIQLKKHLSAEYPYFSDSETSGAVYGKWFRENLAVEGWHSKDEWIAILGRTPTIGTKNRFTAFDSFRDYRRNPFLVQSPKTQMYAPIPFLKNRIGECVKCFQECLNSQEGEEPVSEKMDIRAILCRECAGELDAIEEIGRAFLEHLNLGVRVVYAQKENEQGVKYLQFAFELRKNADYDFRLDVVSGLDDEEGEGGGWADVA